MVTVNVKRLKRMCSVRGCRNTDSFSVSGTREHGNTVIMCGECIKAALAAIEECTQAAPSEKKQYETAPQLFFEGEAEPVKEDTAAVTKSDSADKAQTKRSRRTK